MLGCTKTEELPDPKYYIDAAVSAGQRGRAIILFILFLQLLSFLAIRNNYEPNWTLARLRILQQIHPCLKQPNLKSDRCTYLVEETRKKRVDPNRREDVTEEEISNFLIDVGASKVPSKLDNYPTIADWVAQKIEFHIGRDMELTQNPIPIVGPIVDINDLWVVSAFVVSVLLYFLYRSYDQEIGIASYIKKKYPLFLDVLEKNQVLTHYVSAEGASALTVFLLHGKIIFFFLPSFLQAWLLYEDLSTYDLAVLELGSSVGAKVWDGLEVLASLLLLAINCMVWRKHHELENLFKKDKQQSSVE